MRGALAALDDLREFLRAAHPGFPEVFVLEKRAPRNDANAGPVKTNNVTVSGDSETEQTI